MPNGDPHNSCLKSLGEAHQTEKCKICRGFCPKAKKERDFRMKWLLMDSALHPQPASGASDPKPSTSVCSALASVTGHTPRKNLGSRDPRHHESPVLKTSFGESTHLLVSDLFFLCDRGCSPTKSVVRGCTNRCVPPCSSSYSAGTIDSGFTGRSVEYGSNGLPGAGGSRGGFRPPLHTGHLLRLPETS